MSWIVVIAGLAVALIALVTYLTAPLKAVPVPIRGRHLLITGGSSGIGLEIAKLAAAEGARAISLVARDPRKLADAKNLIIQHLKTEVKISTYSADVKNFGSINAAIEAAVADSGDIEVLILSHGVSYVLTFEDGTLENYDHVIDTNLKGNIYTIKAALPHIKASEGAPASISIFSSQAGQVGVYGYSVYSASKFALRGLAECLQQELVDRNIRVSLVYPPDTMTPGYLEDMKTIPEITKILSGSSTALDAVSVARASLAGVKAGRFQISCNLEGAALSVVCAGMSPQPTLVIGVVEIVSMGLMRIIALFVQKGWYDTILQHKRKDRRPKKSE